MHGLAYTNRCKSIFSRKRNEKKPSFQASCYTKSEAGDTKTHLIAPLRILKHQQNTLPKRPKAIQPVQNFVTFSHHTSQPRRCATTRCKLQKMKCTQVKFPHQSVQNLWKRQNARSSFEEKPPRLHMEIFGGLYMRSR
jgi:hypothetical protein